MPVKESVREFVQDVKRKFSFSHKRKRESCSTCSYDGGDGSLSDSTTDTNPDFDSRRDSIASSLLSSSSRSPERSRFGGFVRPRVSSTSSSKHHRTNLYKSKSDGKRYRFVSSEHPPNPPHSLPTKPVDRTIQWSPLSIQDVGEECETIESSQADYTDVVDIRATISSVEETSQSTPHYSSQTDSSRTDTSGTIVASAPSSMLGSTHSALDQTLFGSKSRSGTSGSVIATSTTISDSVSSFDRHDIILLYPMASAQHSHLDPDAAADLRDQEVILAPSLDKSTPAPLSPSAIPQVSRLAHPTSSTPASPAPVYIPRLTASSMFLPIPNTDPLGALLTKYVPAEQRPRRDVAGEYAGRDVHEMVMSNSWRALAKMARDRIVASDPEDLGRILDLWSLRLSSLARLRLTNQASAECTNLFAVLNAVPPSSVPGSFPASGSLPPSVPLPSSPAPTAPLPLSPSGLSGLVQLPGTPSQKPPTLPSLPGGGTAPAMAPRHGANELVHPFELTVFHARVHYWSGDLLGYVDALSRILELCKKRAREEARVVVQRREARETERDVESASQSVRAGEVEVRDECDDEEHSETAEEGVEDHDECDDEEHGETAEEGVEDHDEEDGRKEEAKPAGESTGNAEVQDESEGEEDTEAADESSESGEVEEQDDVLVAAEANLSMWLERIARVCLILASQMIEMNDYQAAINLLVPLCTHRAPPTFAPTPSPALQSALARVYLLSGNLEKAGEHFSIAALAAGKGSDIVVMNTALLAAASGEWTRAEEALGEMVAKDPGNYVAINNLAVTLLCQGRIKEGIDLLEAALKASPSFVVVAEPFLFNLSTLYELRSTTAVDKKRELLLEVARWSGDGLKTTCLKMPSS